MKIVALISVIKLVSQPQQTYEKSKQKKVNKLRSHYYSCALTPFKKHLWQKNVAKKYIGVIRHKRP